MTDMSPMPRYAFVAGLHRSGTSLLARLLAAQPGVSALAAPEAPEAEGAYVQGAIPHTAQHGIPGAFGEDPSQHYTEAHPLNTLSTRLRLEADWGSRFAPDAVWRLEKSPVNLLRTRLYQQLFPLSQFIIIVRHPVAVAQATAKWSDRSQAELVAHWEAAHARFLDDLPYLHACLVLRYEDLIAAPERTLAAAAQFLTLPTEHQAPTEPIEDGNARYRADADPGSIARQLGYGAAFTPAAPLAPALACRHPLKSIQHAVAEKLAGGTALPDARSAA